MPHSKLAGYGKSGKIWVNPNVPKKLQARLRRHERVERKLRQQGLSYRQAHRRALKEEHRGMTKKQIAEYEGTLGAVARWYPRKRKR